MKLLFGEAFAPLYEPPGRYEHIALYGGRGGGKSYSVSESIGIHMSQREERVVCARQFQASIKDSVKETLEKAIYRLNMAAFFKVTDTEIYHPGTKSRVTFIGMDRNPDSAKSLEGCSLFWGEEASLFSERAVEVIVPTIRATGSRLIWTWNPRYASDPVDAMFRGGHPPEKSYVAKVGYQDNPFFHQTRMPSDLRRLQKAKPKRVLHIYGGGYDENPDAAIFTNFEIGRPVVPLKAVPRFGMDFGFSNDPNFLVKAYFLPEQDAIYVAQEACGYHVPNRNIPDMIDQVSEVKDYEIVADSARPETIEYLQSKGYMIRGARKGAGSIKNGITFIEGFKVIIDPDCPIMYQEFQNYKWKLDPNGKPMPFPAEHQQDHGIDALRYALEDDATNDTEYDGGVAYL